MAVRSPLGGRRWTRFLSQQAVERRVRQAQLPREGRLGVASGRRSRGDESGRKQRLQRVATSQPLFEALAEHREGEVHVDASAQRIPPEAPEQLVEGQIDAQREEENERVLGALVQVVFASQGVQRQLLGALLGLAGEPSGPLAGLSLAAGLGVPLGTGLRQAVEHAPTHASPERPRAALPGGP